MTTNAKRAVTPAQPPIYKLVYYVNRMGDIVLTAKTYRRRYNRRTQQRHGRVLFVTNKGRAYLDELALEQEAESE